MLAAALVSLALAADADALARRADGALARSREALVSSPEVAGGRGTTGERALAILAALRAGAPTDAQGLAQAISRVFAEAEAAALDAYGGAYHAGVCLLLIEEIGGRAADMGGERLVRGLAERLAAIQLPDGGWGDTSRTEFACLGLRAAERMGARVPDAAWARAERWLVSRQLPDGGWGYREGDPATGSMTAGASAALVAAGLDTDAPPVRRGLAWLGERFRAEANPGEDPSAAVSRSSGARHRFYWLAGVASLARELGEWPGPPRAAEGAEALLAEQLPDGRWAGDAQDRPTEFATLFIVEARRALAGPRPRVPVTVGVLGPGARGLPKGAGPALARAIGRWTDMRVEVRFREATLRGDALGDAGFAFVVLLAEKAPPLAPDVAELAGYVAGGGSVVVEGDAALPREDVLALARRIRGDGGQAAEALDGPAPTGGGEAPEVLSLGAGVLVAPRGVFGLLGREGDPGSRSPAARAAANAFALAMSR